MTSFVYGRRLHHHETDADGVCHFSNYLRLFEEAFSDALCTVGLPPQSLPHGFAVTEAHTVYRSPLRYGDRFELTLSFHKVRRAAMAAEAIVRRANEVCATVMCTLAAVDRASNASIPLDRRLRLSLGEPRQEITTSEDIPCCTNPSA